MTWPMWPTRCPALGVVVIFHNPSGEYHVALIKSIGPDGNFVVNQPRAAGDQ
jgi:hypothetical protein